MTAVAQLLPSDTGLDLCAVVSSNPTRIYHFVSLCPTWSTTALILHTQEVRSSSLRAPTIVFNNLRVVYVSDSGLCPLCVRNLPVAQHSFKPPDS